jgi:hypothetical protein
MAYGEPQREFLSDFGEDLATLQVALDEGAVRPLEEHMVDLQEGSVESEIKADESEGSRDPESSS